ncbi:MAG: RidA family protein [Oricola sp.]|jgi:enamine deaminase RidA (YjgF/YER057c/UK114 family)|nr:RidA family protein [Oricola sp.]
MRRLVLACPLWSVAFAAAAAEPVNVPGPHGGGAYYLTEQQKEMHDAWGYAGAYRAGDFVYLSGVVTGSPDGAPLDAETFKEHLRRSFRYAGETLEAAGASFEEVVDITSFHVWNSPAFPAGKIAHMEALAAVKREFMPAPDPAWTAIGVSELLPDNGLVEIRMIAYAPQ